MKRLYLLLLFLVLITSIHAQLQVDFNGNVGIKAPTANPLNSIFTINSQGLNGTCAYISSTADSLDIGLKVYKAGLAQTAYDYTTAIRCSVSAAENSGKKIYGLYSHVYKGNITDTNCGRTYGVYGIAGNATSGWNYGLFGTLTGNNNGTAVFGSSDSWNGGVCVDDRYAGYFHGKVKATCSMEATAFNVSSDYRIKENIKSIDSEKIDDLMKLNVVQYNLKQRFADTGDTTTILVNYYADDSVLLQKTHYGLIAQELQEIYPDLVYEDGDGFLSVNYIEIIPLLIETIQDLTLKVEALSDTNLKTISRGEKDSKTDNKLFNSELFQNSPNPFTENTNIRCIIPNGISKADLYIYDMNGRQIEGISIYERGNVSITIKGSSLDAGIYLYSLITDGVVVDTKRMILTR